MFVGGMVSDIEIFGLGVGFGLCKNDVVLKMVFD